jgi:hypothetical protein
MESLLSTFLSQNFVWISHVPHTWSMFRSSNSTWFQNKRFGYLLYTYFSIFPLLTWSLLLTIISPTPYFQTTPFKTRNHVTQPAKTTSNIIFIFTVILIICIILPKSRTSRCYSTFLQNKATKLSLDFEQIILPRMRSINQPHARPEN